jgi:hypothetical protein
MIELLTSPLAIGGIIIIVAIAGYFVYAYMGKKWPF